MAETKNSYLKLIVFIFLMFASLIAAITTGFFGASGLFYAQGVYENSILTNADKYQCLTNCGTSSATYNTSVNITSYTNYGLVRDSMDAKVMKYLDATTIAFSLLTLVFLFLALDEAGIFSRRKNAGKKDLY